MIIILCIDNCIYWPIFLYTSRMVLQLYTLSVKREEKIYWVNSLQLLGPRKISVSRGSYSLTMKWPCQLKQERCVTGEVVCSRKFCLDKFLLKWLQILRRIFYQCDHSLTCRSCLVKVCMHFMFAVSRSVGEGYKNLCHVPYTYCT